MLTNKNGEDYDRFKLMEGWGFIDIPYEYTRKRKKAPEELLNKRRAHMIQMYEKGNPYAWIARLYEMDRAQVRRIIKGLPNN